LPPNKTHKIYQHCTARAGGLSPIGWPLLAWRRGRAPWRRHSRANLAEKPLPEHRGVESSWRFLRSVLALRGAAAKHYASPWQKGDRLSVGQSAKFLV